jgi:hypothetical protein
MKIRLAERISSVLVLALFWAGSAMDATGAGPTETDLTKMTGACWSSEVSKEVVGKCPAELKDSSQLCLNQTMGGGVEGNLSMIHSEFLHADKVAPDDAMTCFTPTSSTMSIMQFDVSVSPSPKNDLLLSELHHKCTVGECKAQKTALKGTLVFDGDTLVFSPSSGGKLRFQKLKTPEKTDDAK